jgi:hypothetical protein
MKPTTLAFEPRHADAVPVEVLRLQPQSSAPFDRPPHAHRLLLGARRRHGRVLPTGPLTMLVAMSADAVAAELAPTK